MITLNRRGLLAAVAVVPALVLGAPAFAQGGDVTLTHYFTGEFGLKIFNEQVAKFEADTGYTIKNSPIGHEDFKTDILVRAAGDSLPDVFSYWAGARTQFVVDSGSLHSIDEMWARDGLDSVVAKSVADSATMYNGKRYLVPFNYHYAGMFYNTQVLADAGVTDMPTTWDGFMALCETLKANGVTPIALGSKNRWPAQFWFDYLLLGTAGPDYRASLMNGSAAYDDAEVKAAMAMWKDLADKGYFAANANADSWTDASDKVARGDAAMTLMGTWITGYWNGLGAGGRKGLRLLPVPVHRRGRSRVGGRSGGRSGHLQRRGEPCRRRGVPELHDVERRCTGELDRRIRGALRQRQRRSGELQRGHAAGLHRCGRSRQLRVQLRPRDPAAGGGGRALHVLALHGRPEPGGRHPRTGRRGRRAGVHGVDTVSCGRAAGRYLPGGPSTCRHEQ